MRRLGVVVLAGAAAVAAAALSPSSGCLTDNSESESGGWAVEIGHFGASPFKPVADADPLTVTLGPQGADMVQVDLRVVVPPGGSPPGAVRIRASELVDDQVVGGWAQNGGDWVRGDTAADGHTSYTITDFRIVFTAEPCCFMCSGGGSVTVEVGQARPIKRKVLFQRTACPDTVACCYPKGGCPGGGDSCQLLDTCPNPATATRCGAPGFDAGAPDLAAPDGSAGR